MSKPLHPVEKFFNRYNFVTFVVLATLSLAAVIFLCYSTYTKAVTPNTPASHNDTPTNFDKDTADAINKLHTSDNAPSPSIPSNIRINPFVE